MRPGCSDSPPDTPDEEDELDAAQFKGTSSEVFEDEGGFCGDEGPSNEVVNGYSKDRDESRGEDLHRDFTIQPPTADFPSYRIVPNGGFATSELQRAALATAAAEGDSRVDERRVCRECGSVACSQRYFENFSVSVCHDCTKEKGDIYGLLTKSRAKEEYLVSDKDLEGLGFVTQKNPRKDSWSDMKLLLRLQVMQRALQRHGSAEELERAKDKNRQEAAKRKRQREGKTSVLRQQQPGTERTPEAAFADDGSRGLGMSAAAARPQASRQRVSEAVARAAAARHVHAWGADWYDAAAETWRRRCIECNLVVSFEKI